MIQFHCTICGKTTKIGEDDQVHITYQDGICGECSEPKPDNNRLLTLKEIKKIIIDYGLTRHVSYDPKYFTHNMPEFMKVRDAQDARTARILTRVPDEGLRDWIIELISSNSPLMFATTLSPEEQADQILTKFKNYVELDPDQSLPEPHIHPPEMTLIRFIQDLKKDGWKKVEIKGG